MGATEYGWFHCIEGGNEHWNALRLYTDIGYQFEEVSDDVFELVIVKDSKTEKLHGIFDTFPELDQYRTRDLYSQLGHGWWQYKGRADDLIVLSNGEKVNPIPLENIIQSHPKIRAALVVGEYQFSPSSLVELEAKDMPRTSEERRQVLDNIWPIVQEANKIAPAFSKVPKALILLAPPEKPFCRAGKGTVQRQNTVKEYSQELDELFSSQEATLLTERLSLATPVTPRVVKIFTREIYLQVLQMNDVKTALDDFENVFEKGMDSLGVTIIVQRLRAALKTCKADIDLKVINSRLVYAAPSINQVSDAINALLKCKKETFIVSSISGQSLRKRKMEEILHKYSKDIPSGKSNGMILERLQKGTRSGEKEKAWNIILTGTTGSLGSCLLEALEALPESRVAKIYCLNRSANSRERQKRASLSRGLNDSWDGRVQFLQTLGQWESSKSVAPRKGWRLYRFVVASLSIAYDKYTVQLF
jgi:hypothetical protein